MTMIEVGVWLVWAAMCWYAGKHLWGDSYAIPCAVVGVALPFGIYYGYAFARDIVLGLLDRWPPRPMCENGRCKWRDYRKTTHGREGATYVCRCGMTYVKSGPRFLKVAKDGRAEPYKVRVRGRWIGGRRTRDSHLG